MVLHRSSYRDRTSEFAAIAERVRRASGTSESGAVDVATAPNVRAKEGASVGNASDFAKVCFRNDLLGRRRGAKRDGRRAVDLDSIGDVD